MENKANYAVVGVIATAVLVALFGFVYWFAGPSSNTQTATYEVIFTGTVSGLSAGTEVQFNGIKVGQVKTVTLDPDDINRVIARMEIDAAIPIKADTKALMGFQGLTGVGSLQLSGGTASAGDPPTEPGRNVPTLYAKVSDFQSILDGLSTTINGTATAVDRLNGFLDTNDEKLNETISNVATFSDALAANADGVKDALATIAEAGKQVGPMAEQIGALSSKLGELTAAIPPEKVTQVVDNVAEFSETLSRNSGKVDEFFAAASTLSDDITKMSATLSTSVDRIDAVTAAIDPEAVTRIVANADTFSSEISTVTAELKDILAALPPEKVATVVDDITTFTDSLARNSEQIDSLFAATGTLAEGITTMVANLDPAVVKINQVAAEIDPAMVSRVLGNVDDFATKLGDNATNIDSIVANLTEISNSLVGSATKVDEILEKVDGSVNNAEGEGLFAQIGDAAVSIRQLADQLNTSTASIAVGLNNFTSSGLPGYAALAEEARATLARLDRVVRNLESNPQGLIFGGETVRDYNKR
ncbi:MlaD family protein [Devosia sp. J2-20]|uniref:MlaD family protein n=1 Tax=Devosia sp. J2-20 TaxID=3026161 RepID=UPI00249CACC2|nr:MlaD family protein [Devosia sp. J2-20]WDQ99186.1 MlaD family protein [Devosia sp. J2-20]